MALTVRHEGEPSDAGPDERAVLVAVTREMLTNALRHGDRAAPVDVLLRWSGDGVLIRVRNREGTGDGTGRPRATRARGTRGGPGHPRHAGPAEPGGREARHGPRAAPGRRPGLRGGRLGSGEDGMSGLEPVRGPSR